MNPLKYQPAKLTTAQKLLVAMGLDDLRLVAHHGGKRETYTKAGPGRVHMQGDGKTPHVPSFADNLMKVWADKRAEQLRKSRAA